jgi:hypothetical protein
MISHVERELPSNLSSQKQRVDGGYQWLQCFEEHEEMPAKQYEISNRRSDFKSSTEMR